MSSLKELQSSSYLYGSNAAYVEELYELYLQDSSLVPDFWREYFDGLQNQPAVDGKESTRDQAHGPIIRSFAERAKANGFVGHGGAQDLSIATKRTDPLCAPWPSEPMPMVWVGMEGPKTYQLRPGRCQCNP